MYTSITGVAPPDLITPYKSYKLLRVYYTNAFTPHKIDLVWKRLKRLKTPANGLISWK